MADRRVGVVGAGVMGAGVAEVLARTQHDVILIDCEAEALDRALSSIASNVKMMRLLGKSRDGLKPDEILARIRTTQDYEELAETTFVIENVTEKWSVKQGVYATLDAVCPEECVFAANTSAIPITKIAGATARPSQVLGMHFMNPVPMKPTVEVIRGYHTSEDTLGRAAALLERMGKEGVTVEDAPGFVSNRVLMLTVNEAIWLVHDGVAPAEDVDRIFKSCFGHPMGPLETADMIGLDTILFSVEVLQESFGDSKYRPCPLLKKMVDAGLHGRKSGQGFYDYRL
jgi:3-hydroxybutyryl-CoA dehydrogenase